MGADDRLVALQEVAARACAVKVEVTLFDESGADQAAEPQTMSWRIQWPADWSAEQKLESFKRVTAQLNVAIAAVVIT